MDSFRIALANLPFPETPDQSIALTTRALERAAGEGAQIICFPECFVPGYRALSKALPAPDAAFLERAWSAIAESAGRAGIAVVLGSERATAGLPVASALIIDSDGTRAGFQDKVQLDRESRSLAVRSHLRDDPSL